jgi:hypothetical protein
VVGIFVVAVVGVPTATSVGVSVVDAVVGAPAVVGAGDVVGEDWVAETVGVPESEGAFVSLAAVDDGAVVVDDATDGVSEAATDGIGDGT